MKNKNHLLSHPSMSWLLPIIAVIVALWMIYPEYIDQGTQITISFPSADGIQPDNTTLQYLGIPAGKVKAVVFNKDMKGVKVTIRLEEDAKTLARKGSKFWVDKPQVGFSGFSGLDTLLSGAHISVIPGPTDAPAEKSFVGLSSPPALNQNDIGKAFYIYDDHMGTLQPRAAVMYKGYKVGEVETTQMTPDARGFLTRLRIYKPYVNLVRENTKFWDAGGLSVNMSLFGANIKTTSLESIITGAIALATPDEPGVLATEGAQFKLYPKAQDEWQKWSPEIQVDGNETLPQKKTSISQELEKPLNQMDSGAHEK